MQVANGATITLPGDGTYTISHRVYDVAGQLTSYVNDTVKVDTVVPVLTSAAAPTAWQTSPLSLDITGTDAGGSGVDHAEWKLGATGTVTTGTPAVISTDGTPTLYTRVVDKAGNGSVWRQENIKVDTTKPANTTPAIASGWRRTNLTTSVTGTDATSGVARVEWKLDNASATATTTPAVSVTTEGTHTLWSRIVDVAGNASDWRQDDFGIDKTVPTLAADCGVATWRNTAPVCTISASGGVSGLATVTAARDSGDPVDVSSGTYTVGADGAATINFRAVDGAGNVTTASSDVKVDRVLPSASASCAAGAGVTWVCTVNGADALSGLTALAYSVDGGAPVAIAPGATFVVTKGTIAVTAADAAGNVAAAPPAVLAGPHRDHDDDDDHAAHQQPGGLAQARRLGQRAPGRRALALREPDRDHGRPAPARARQRPLPVRDQGHRRQEEQDLHQDPDHQEGLLLADQRQGRRGRVGQGRPDGQAPLGQQVGHARHGEREAVNATVF